MKHKLIIGIAIVSLTFTSCKKEVENPQTNTSFALSDAMLKTTTTAVAQTQPVKNDFTGKLQKITIKCLIPIRLVVEM